MMMNVGLYKVSTGEDISSAPKPGMFDLKVRKHYHLGRPELPLTDSGT